MSMNPWILRLLLAGLLLYGGGATAVTFANRFVRFEMPSRWRCALEGTEWVCQSWDEERKREAIIVIAAKLQGDQDTFEQYESYLRTPREFATPDGKRLRSRVLSVQRREISGQPWVDATHAESEIPGFQTRYLATIKDGIAVLVTYSIRSTQVQAYQAEFERFVASLKMKRPKDQRE